jgi:hypothetical protein
MLKAVVPFGASSIRQLLKKEERRRKRRPRNVQRLG